MKLRLIENNGYDDLPDKDEFAANGPPCPLCGRINIDGYGFLFSLCQNCDTAYCFACSPGGSGWENATEEQKTRLLSKFETTLEERPGLYFRKPIMRILKCPACN